MMGKDAACYPLNIGMGIKSILHNLSQEVAEDCRRMQNVAGDCRRLHEATECCRRLQDQFTTNIDLALIQNRYSIKINHSLLSYALVNIFGSIS